MKPLLVYMPHSGVYHLVDRDQASTHRGMSSVDHPRCGGTLHGGVILDCAPVATKGPMAGREIYMCCSVCKRVAS